MVRNNLFLGGVSLNLPRSAQSAAIVPVSVNLEGSRDLWDAAFSSLQLRKQQVDRGPADLVRILLNPAPIRVYRSHVERSKPNILRSVSPESGQPNVHMIGFVAKGGER